MGSAPRWRRSASVRSRRLKFAKTPKLRSVQLNTSRSTLRLRITMETLPLLTWISSSSSKKTLVHPTRKPRSHKEYRRNYNANKNVTEPLHRAKDEKVLLRKKQLEHIKIKEDLEVVSGEITAF